MAKPEQQSKTIPMGVAPPANAPPSGPRIVGSVEMRELNTVAKNPWNPNVMTAFEKESLKNGLTADGWLASQALLIWGTDEKGKLQNLIIDGEHRWTSARELGLASGPMVVLNGLTEAQAKALTIKMNAKRGKFQEDKLADLIRSIQFELDVPDLSLDLGIMQDDIMKALAVQPENLAALGDVSAPPVVPPPSIEPKSIQAGHVVLVQMFFSKPDHEEFVALARAFAEKAATKNISDTVLAAMRATKAP